MSGAISISVSGLKETVEALRRISANAPAAIGNAMYGWAEYVVMPQARDECPHVTGYLRRSGSPQGGGGVQDPVVSADNISVTFGFTADYAIYVHENLEANHPSGKAKFLEDPAMQHAEELHDVCAKAVNETVEAEAA